MKKIGIVGSTGSIGVQALDVIGRHPNRFEIVFLSCNYNVELLINQALAFNPEYIISTGQKIEQELKNTKVLFGNQALLDVIRNENIDLVLIATTGFSGVLPTYTAAQRGLTIALANKESIVAAGLIIIDAIKSSGACLIPVDSEHSAIFQCLMGQDKDKISNVILTASGGPFRNRPYDSFEFIQKEEALRHPNWKMGAKITVDSATMMNKGLELIEARYLFDLPPDKLSVIIHPQSIIHSMVSFIDGSYLAQLGCPDMRVPISFALNYPDRLSSGVNPIDFAKIHSLTFEDVDFNKYKCLKLATEVLHSDSNNLMIAMNAANEVAVECFLKDRITFPQIYQVIYETINKFSKKNITNIEEIFEMDILSREMAHKIATTL